MNKLLNFLKHTSRTRVYRPVVVFFRVVSIVYLQVVFSHARSCCANYQQQQERTWPAALAKVTRGTLLGGEEAVSLCFRSIKTHQEVHEDDDDSKSGDDAAGGSERGGPPGGSSNGIDPPGDGEDAAGKTLLQRLLCSSH